ncbi:MAG: CRTAC1 family protein [Chthoniobacterales bacterium]
MSMLLASFGGVRAGEPSVQFTDVTEAANLRYLPPYHVEESATPFGTMRGGFWADIEGDGDLDVYVMNHGFDRLHVNNGDGTFSERGETVFVNDAITGYMIKRDSHNGSWGDFDNNGTADFYVINCGEDARTFPGETEKRRPTRPVSSPNKFYLNDGSVLTESATKYGVSYDEAAGSGGLWCDVNHDGKLDLLLCLTDRRDGLCPSTIFVQNEDGTFTASHDRLGIATAKRWWHACQSDLTGDGTMEIIINGGSPIYSTRSIPLTSLPSTGAANDALGADLDNDGRLELVQAKPKVIQIRRYDGSDFTNEKIAMPDLGEAPWGIMNLIAGDFDNDMDTDLYVVTGRKNDPKDKAFLSYGETTNPRNVLLLNDGEGKFSDAGPVGLDGPQKGAGGNANPVDFDNDGFLDIYVQNFQWPAAENAEDEVGPSFVYRNQPNGNHWIEIDLVGRSLTRDALGAKVFVTCGETTQLREQNGGQHNRGQNPQRLHFGLGPHEFVSKIEVVWPSGERQRLQNVAADQILTITENVPTT